jgi:DNA invertase Pin-like site-specific DNA recombinase
VLCVTKLDRLARSVAHLCELVARLQAKSVALRILNLNIDTGTPTGKLMLHLLGSIAEFERQIMLERQREGIAKAKSEGKYRGRAPTARAKTELVLEMVRAGKTREAVAEELNISARSVFRILRDHGVSKKAPVERAA